MTHRRPARRTIHRTRIRWTRVAGLLGVLAAVAVTLGDQLRASSTSTASTPAAPVVVQRSEDPGVLGEADGAVPDGASVFADELSGVANLDADLRDALRRAATDAGHDGVTFVVDSGWRSPEYQEHLLQEAVAKYGSEQEAARWVATPETSAHVSGDAVDIGPSEATAWLSERGSAYGLCPIYANEPWHYELRPEAADLGCPPTYPDPTHDPRMQR